MVETSFNLFDAVVIAILFLSTLLSFFRGFVRELLSLSSWVAAMVITAVYAPDLAEAIEKDINKGSAAALLVASSGLFIGAKIVFSIINLLLMKLLKSGKDIGVLDNLLGLAFGFLRAALLISLSYYVYSYVASEENQPLWIAESETRPYVAKGAQMLEPMLAGFLEKATPMLEERAESLQAEGVEQMRIILERQQEGGGADIDPSSAVNPQDLQRLLDQLERQRNNADVLPKENRLNPIVFPNADE